MLFRWLRRSAPRREEEPAALPHSECDGRCAKAGELRIRLDLGLRMASAAISTLEDARGTTGRRHAFALIQARDFLWSFVNDGKPGSGLSR